MQDRRLNDFWKCVGVALAGLADYRTGIVDARYDDIASHLGASADGVGKAIRTGLEPLGWIKILPHRFGYLRHGYQLSLPPECEEVASGNARTAVRPSSRKCTNGGPANGRTAVRSLDGPPSGDNYKKRKNEEELSLREPQLALGTGLVETRKLPNQTPYELAPTWQPTERHFELATALSLSREDVTSLARRMQNWAEAKAVRRANWNAQFRNFIEKEASDRSKRGGSPTASPPHRRSAIDLALADIARRRVALQ